MKADKTFEKASHVSSAFFAHSPSDWSVKKRHSRFPAIGYDQKSAKTFDSYLDNDRDQFSNS